LRAGGTRDAQISPHRALRKVSGENKMGKNRRGALCKTANKSRKRSHTCLVLRSRNTQRVGGSVQNVLNSCWIDGAQGNSLESGASGGPAWPGILRLEPRKLVPSRLGTDRYRASTRWSTSATNAFPRLPVKKSQAAIRGRSLGGAEMRKEVAGILAARFRFHFSGRGLLRAAVGRQESGAAPRGLGVIGARFDAGTRRRGRNPTSKSPS